MGQPVWDTPPDTGRQEPVERGPITTLEVVSLIAGFGSIAFMAAPMFLGAFGMLTALAGAVCGWVARTRPDATKAATVGAAVGTVMSLLFLIGLLA